MSRWYRAYEGTVTDAKLGEVALVAECSRSVVIAAWHCILESCAAANRSGNFDATLRRVAVILCEPIPVMERVFSEFENLGLIQGNYVPSWSRRQYESDNSTARSKKHRENKKAERCNNDATLHDRCATPPETETETETETDISSLRSDSASAPQPNSDLNSEIQIKPEPIAKPKTTKPPKPVKTALDQSAIPTADDRTYAANLGMTEATLANEWEKFKLNHIQRQTRAIDWAMTWQTWARNWVGYGARNVETRQFGSKSPVMNVVPAIDRESSAKDVGKVWIKADTPEWDRAVQRLGRKPPNVGGGWYFDKDILGSAVSH